MSGDYSLQEARALKSFLDNCAVTAYAAVMAWRGIAQGPEHLALRWPQASKQEREAMLKAVTHWTVNFVEVPEAPDAELPPGFTIQEHRIIKAVVDAIRVHADACLEEPCLRGAGLAVTTAFECQRSHGHKGPCLPAFVPEPEEMRREH